MANNKPLGPRTIAIVGPYLSGKTTLFESVLHICGAIHRKGTVADKNTTGDSSPEARERGMSVELNVGHCRYLDDSFTFLDCPGSIEFVQETLNALVGVDAAVVVCEPEPERALTLAPLLHYLDQLDVPRFLFVNKIDKARGRIRDLLQALQAVSAKPLVLRQVPVREMGRDGTAHVTGYVDLAHQRAYVYRDNAPSEIVAIPEQVRERQIEARQNMLEKLADFDDRLMEDLLADVVPTRDAVFADLAKDLQEGKIVPVLLGAGHTDHGVRRLLKALRHEAPAPAQAAIRAGVDPASRSFAGQVLKTFVTAHGKLSLVRIYSGTIKDGATVNGDRIGGLFRLLGSQLIKISDAQDGDTVALGRLENARTGDTLREGKGGAEACPRAPQLSAVYSLAVRAANRNDEVKMSTAFAKLCEEDPSLQLENNADTQETLLNGQGEMHLRVALARLKTKYGLSIDAAKPKVAYKEAIRKGIAQHGRYKRQTGGHGQFGDVYLDVKPLPRGSGFSFESRIVGGAVPRQYVPAVEAGVREYLQAGPLGFPVVDVAVALTDGSYHAVDSSELAFKMAARIAMSEGMPKCDPVLLEPIYLVEIAVPNEFTAKANALISGRRGQILGFDARAGWPGWDVVTAHMPRAEIHDLVIELRSATQGVGTFVAKFDHLQELTGRLADQVLAASRAA
jgi:elongation factor G